MNKTIKRVLLSSVIIIILLYIVYALYYSFAFNSLLDSAFNDEEYVKSEMITKGDYQTMNPKQSEMEEEYSNVSTYSSHSFPLVIPFLTNHVTYVYTYTVTDEETGEVIYGMINNRVVLSIQYKGLSICISDVSVHP